MKTKKKAALKVLGYTRTTWDSRKPPSYYAYWAELTDEEAAAAEQLGYTEASWDNISGDEKQPAFASKKWFQLTVDEKSLLRILGYTETNWNSKPGLPSAAKKRWSELSVCGEYTSVSRTTQ